MVECTHKLAKRPLLYNDTQQGQFIGRDDMWAVTTDELNELDALDGFTESSQQLLANMYDGARGDATHMYNVLEKVAEYMGITWPHDELWVKQLHSEIKSILYNYVQYSTYVDEDEKEQIP